MAEKLRLVRKLIKYTGANGNFKVSIDVYYREAKRLSNFLVTED